MVTKEDIQVTTMHQCMYGLKARDTEGESMAYKPTQMMTTHEGLAGVLTRRCSGGHRHAHVVGKDACTKVAQNPRELCDEVLKAIAVIKKDLEETQVLGIERHRRRRGT